MAGIMSTAMAILAFKVEGADTARAQIAGVGSAYEATAGKINAGNAGLAAAGANLTKFAAVIGLADAAMIAFSGHAAVQFKDSMELIRTQAGASQQEVDKMSASVLKLSTSSVGIGPEKLAEGLYHIESAGFRGAQALDMLHSAAEGARVGHADLEAVTNSLIAVTSSHIGGVKNESDAMAQLNSIVGSGNMRMNDLAAAMSTGILPAAAVAGLKLRDVGAALATLTDNGVPANEAATRLRMTFALMEAPSSKAAKALDSIGISSTQLADDMRQPNGLLVAVEDLKAHLEHAGLSATQQAAVIEHAFGGGRTSSAIETMITQADRLKSKYDEQAQAAARWGDDVKAAESTAAAAVDRARATFEAASIVIGDAFAPAIGKIADAFQHAGAEAAAFAQQHQALVGQIGSAGVIIGGAAVGIWGLQKALAGVDAVLTGMPAVAGGLGRAIFLLMDPAIGLPALAAVVTVIAYEKSPAFRAEVNRAADQLRNDLYPAVLLARGGIDSLGFVMDGFHQKAHDAGVSTDGLWGSIQHLTITLGENAPYIGSAVKSWMDYNKTINDANALYKEQQHALALLSAEENKGVPALEGWVLKLSDAKDAVHRLGIETINAASIISGNSGLSSTALGLLGDAATSMQKTASAAFQKTSDDATKMSSSIQKAADDARNVLAEALYKGDSAALPALTAAAIRSQNDASKWAASWNEAGKLIGASADTIVTKAKGWGAATGNNFAAGLASTASAISDAADAAMGSALTVAQNVASSVAAANAKAASTGGAAAGLGIEGLAGNTLNAAFVELASSAGHLKDKFQELADAADAKAKTALDNLALALQTGKGNIDDLTAAAKYAAGNASTFADSLAAAKALVDSFGSSVATAGKLALGGALDIATAFKGSGIADAAGRAADGAYKFANATITAANGITQAVVNAELSLGLYAKAQSDTATMLKNNLDNALAKLAFDLAHHTGSIIADTAAVNAAQAAITANTKAVNAATVAVSAFGQQIHTAGQLVISGFLSVIDSFGPAAKKSLDGTWSTVDAAGKNIGKSLDDAATRATIDAGLWSKGLSDATTAQKTANDNLALYFYDLANNIAYTGPPLSDLVNNVTAANAATAQYTQAQIQAAYAAGNVFDAQQMQAKATYDSALAAYENAKAAGVSGAALNTLFQAAVTAGTALAHFADASAEVTEAINKNIAALDPATKALGGVAACGKGAATSMCASSNFQYGATGGVTVGPIGVNVPGVTNTGYAGQITPVNLGNYSQPGYNVTLPDGSQQYFEPGQPLPASYKGMPGSGGAPFAPPPTGPPPGYGQMDQYQGFYTSSNYFPLAMRAMAGQAGAGAGGPFPYPGYSTAGGGQYGYASTGSGAPVPTDAGIATAAAGTGYVYIQNVNGTVTRVDAPPSTMPGLANPNLPADTIYIRNVDGTVMAVPALPPGAVPAAIPGVMNLAPGGADFSGLGSTYGGLSPQAMAYAALPPSQRALFDAMMAAGGPAGSAAYLGPKIPGPSSSTGSLGGTVPRTGPPSATGGVIGTNSGDPALAILQQLLAVAQQDLAIQKQQESTMTANLPLLAMLGLLIAQGKRTGGRNIIGTVPWTQYVNNYGAASPLQNP